jgi:hypothetical protein
MTYLKLKDYACCHDKFHLFQWVVFVLVLNAALFILPRKVWKLLEGGIIEQFGKTAKSAFILCDPDRYATIFTIN